MSSPLHPQIRTVHALQAIAVLAISAGVILAAQSGWTSTSQTGTDGSYGMSDIESFVDAFVQAVVAAGVRGGDIEPGASDQTADTFVDMLFADVLDVAHAAHVALSLTATDNIRDTGALELYGAYDIDIFRKGTETYVAVAGDYDNGVQILKITDPDNILVAGKFADTTNSLLGQPEGIATFYSGKNIYVAVASYSEHGVQILNVTDPDNVTAAGKISDSSTLELRGANAISIFKSGDHTYAAVASYLDDGVQILNVTDPANPTATSQITNTVALTLWRAYDITTFRSGGSTYAVVAAPADSGIQILNVTDPTNVTPTGKFTNQENVKLDSVRGVDVYRSDGSTYAIVTAFLDNAVQILNITDVTNITAEGYIEDTVDLELDRANHVAVFESDNHIYGAVVSLRDDGFQMLDITNPNNIIPVGHATWGGNFMLDNAKELVLFKKNDITYAVVVASSRSNSHVQIIKIGLGPDTELPRIAINGADKRISIGTPYDDEGFTCTDNGYGQLTQVTDNPVDINQEDIYTVTYTCTDEAGNRAVATRTVDVYTPDITPPVISILGANPTTVTVGTIYKDEGATCIDAIDGQIFPIWSISDVDTKIAEIYTVEYYCIDEAGNEAGYEQQTEAERKVYVVAAVSSDTVPPVMTLEGSSTVTVPANMQYRDAGATCKDGVDGSITPTSIITADNIGNEEPYTITYSCMDRAGNKAAEVSRTVTVVAAVYSDTVPPVISLIGNSTVIIPVDTRYSDEGATCRDEVDGTLTPTSIITADNIGPGREPYTVVYSCIDRTGNEAVETRTVIIREQEPVIYNTKRSSTQDYLVVDNSMTIDGQSHRTSSGTAIEPYNIMTGQTTDIVFTAYSNTDIIHFTVYLNLHGKDIKYSDSDTYISYDRGAVQVHDPHGFISDASITVTEDSEQPIKNTISTLVEFDGEMGLTNMVVQVWNDNRRSTLIKVFDALDITSGTQMLPDPEPQILPDSEPQILPDSEPQILPDPEPQILPDPEPQILPDPEPQNYNRTAVTTPPDTELSDAEILSIVRVWAGFERGSVTDDELLQALNLDYQGAHIPNWVMTKLGVLVSKGSVSTDEFLTAITYVLENT